MSDKRAERIVSATLSPKDKEDFKAICKAMGLTVSAAVAAFCKHVIKTREIPFELKA